MTTNEITQKIIGCAIEVNRNIGPGLLESAYRECLCYELQNAGLYFEKELHLPVIFKDLHLDYKYRIDVLVEKQIVLELKAVEYLNDVHLAQTLTYMKLGGYKLGLLLNFNVAIMKNGIKRLIL